MAEIAFPTGYERGITPLALHSLRERRRKMLGQATGSVLDLGGCDAHPDLYHGVDRVLMLTTPEESGERLHRRAEGAAVPVEVSDERITELAAQGTTFDTVVSVLQLSLAADIASTLTAIGKLLGDHGRLLFIEPTSTEGLTLRAQRLLATPARLVTSRRLARDVPARIRASGLVITDLERFRLRLLWPYRSFVEGVARRPTPTPSYDQAQ